MKTPSLFFTPFESLKGFLKSASRDEKPSSKPREKHRDAKKDEPVCGEPSREEGREDKKTEREVFLEAMAGVREIKEFSGAFTESGAPVRRPQKPRQDLNGDPMVLLEELVSGKKKIVLEQTGEYIEWAGPGAGPDITRRLHRGEFAVREYIDLHGMSREEALDALHAFFREAIREKAFCVKVIHGRGLRSPGGPVLKEALRKWLQGPFRKHVLAYASARDCDGGLGATYVVLRQRGGTKRFT